jgi:hypothetical protein
MTMGMEVLTSYMQGSRRSGGYILTPDSFIWVLKQISGPVLYVRYFVFSNLETDGRNVQKLMAPAPKTSFLQILHWQRFILLFLNHFNFSIIRTYTRCLNTEIRPVPSRNSSFNVSKMPDSSISICVRNLWTLATGVEVTPI